MADTKITSNGNVDIWFIPAASLVDYRSPTPTEINTLATRVTPAVAWDGTTFPANSDSNDTDDRSLEDRGNATSRGFASFEATLALFRPKPGDLTSEAAVAWNLLKTPRVAGYLITRVLQRTTGVATPAAAGDWISVYRVVSDTVNDETEGEDSYKFVVTFLQQGDLAVYTQVKNAGPITLLPATLAITTAGPVKTVRATLGGKRATQAVTWSVADGTKATVSQNGVVKGIAAGSTTVTATHPSATGSTTAVTVTVT
jgi:hypothetical protein